MKRTPPQPKFKVGDRIAVVETRRTTAAELFGLSGSIISASEDSCVVLFGGGLRICLLTDEMELTTE